jgi:hypothetical protein
MKTTWSVLTTNYYSSNSFKNQMGEAGSTYGGVERCRKDLVKKSEGNRPPGRTRHMWEDNIKQPSINRMGAGSGFIRLTTGTGGGPLRTP